MGASPKASSANYNSGLGPDFKFELLPLHSPLLGQSLLVSFPPLIDMLKFSGYSYLIRGQPCDNFGGLAAGKHAGTGRARARSTALYCAQCSDEPADELGGPGPLVGPGRPNTKPELEG